MMGLKALSGEWLEYARTDLRTAEFLKNMEPVPHAVICFHCQQTAEKAMKGFLILHGQEPPRIHDLEILCNLCNKIQAGFLQYETACVELTQYAVVARYPNLMQINPENTQVALKSAASILAFVESVIE